MLEPPAGACLLTSVAERPVALPLNLGGRHVHGRRISQIRTRLPPVGRQGSNRRAAKHS